MSEPLLKAQIAARALVMHVICRWKPEVVLKNWSDGTMMVKPKRADPSPTTGSKATRTISSAMNHAGGRANQKLILVCTANRSLIGRERSVLVIQKIHPRVHPIPTTATPAVVLRCVVSNREWILASFR